MSSNPERTGAGMSGGARASPSEDAAGETTQPTAPPALLNLSSPSVRVAKLLHDGVPVELTALKKLQQQHKPEPFPELELSKLLEPCLRPNMRPSRGGLRTVGELPTVAIPPAGESDPEASLREVCERGDAGAAARWLSAGARVNSVNRHNCTALHAAVGRGHVQVVRLLLEAQADHALRTNLGFDALSVACQAGKADCVDELLSAGCNLESKCGSNGCTALHTAVRMGHADVIRALVKAGADQSALTVRGLTPHEICAVAPSAPWAGFTSKRILEDPTYLSPSDLENNFPSLQEMLDDGEVHTSATAPELSGAGGDPSSPDRWAAADREKFGDLLSGEIERERAERDAIARAEAAADAQAAHEKQMQRARKEDAERRKERDAAREQSFAQMRQKAEARTQELLAALDAGDPSPVQLSKFHSLQNEPEKETMKRPQEERS